MTTDFIIISWDWREDADDEIAAAEAKGYRYQATVADTGFDCNAVVMSRNPITADQAQAEWDANEADLAS